MRKLSVCLVLVLAVAGARAQAYQQLLDDRTRDLLHEELSGELAKEHVLAITRWSRVQGSRQYRNAAQYVLAQLRAYGYGEDEAWIESFPSDGRIEYQTWQSPSGFDMEWAELRMLEPHAERIVGYPEVAMSLMTYSNPGTWEGELVWAGRGTADEHYAGLDVEGKIVLATGYGGQVHRMAVVQRGALGVVCFLDDARAREYPDMLAYTGMWPRAAELPKVTFGFNLTNRQGRKLLSLLEAGEQVVVRGEARGIGLEPYEMDLPTAFIRGGEKPDEILIYTAHLDHPKESANDNASGSAALLDMARGLKTLIDAGRLPRPRRTLQFLWVPEFFGTAAYVDKHEDVRHVSTGGRYLANINMDMVGEHQELLHSAANFTRTLASAPSVLNDVVENMVHMVARMEIRTPRGSLSTFNYRVTPFMPGSDHMFFLDRGIPAMMFWHNPDYTHHTSEDTPDKVDPVELEREEIIAAASFLYLSDLDAGQATELAWLAGANAARRLGLAARRANALLQAVPPGEAHDPERYVAWAEARNLLDHHADWAAEAVDSIRGFREANDRPNHALGATLLALKAQHQALIRGLNHEATTLGLRGGAPPPLPFTPDERVPRRTTRAPINGNYLEERSSEEDRAWLDADDNPVRGNVRFELHNLIDGKRTVSEIRNALAAEFGPLDHAAVVRHVELLARADLVRLP